MACLIYVRRKTADILIQNRMDTKLLNKYIAGDVLPEEKKEEIGRASCRERV